MTTELTLVNGAAFTVGAGHAGALGCPDLVVVGSVSADRITTAFSPAVEVLGGAGLYAALGAAALGIRVGLVGVAGAYIAPAAAALLARRVEHRGLVTVPGLGLRFDIAYDKAWVAHYRVDGAEAERVIGYCQLSATYPMPAAVHLCPTGAPDVQSNLVAALRAEHGAKVFVSATTFRNRIRDAPDTVRALWRMADLFVCDTTEVRLLTAVGDLSTALQAAVEVTGHRVTCVTDAHRRGYLISDGTVTEVPAYPTATVDPTGAGESFAGAMAAARLARLDVPTASAAAATASLTVEDFGALRLAHADPAEVRRRAAALARAAGAAGAGHG